MDKFTKWLGNGIAIALTVAIAAVILALIFRLVRWIVGF